MTTPPLCVALVGLPARGKTYISRKLARYFNWVGINTKGMNNNYYYSGPSVIRIAWDRRWFGLVKISD